MVSAGLAGHQPWLPLLGLAAGLGSAGARRPPAWLAGLYGGPGWGGVLGAAAGFVALAMVGSTWVFLLAAALAALGALDQEGHEVRFPAVGALVPAAMAMATIIGLRVVEPALVSDRLSAALFGVSWAAGIQIGWARAPTADARGTLALPFIAAAALAGLSVVTGPGMVFLWALVAASVGGVLGVSTRVGRFQAWPWVGLLAAGAASGWFMAGESIDFALWTAGSVALAGGFGSLLIAGRVREPAITHPMSVPASSVPIPEPSGPSPAEHDPELAAAIMLLEALRQARKIRSAALEGFRRAVPRSPVSLAGDRAQSILVDLTRDARRAAESLRSASYP